MREELNKIILEEFWVYGLNETDFDYILRLTRAYINCRQIELEEAKQKAIFKYPDPRIHEEIISDLGHYIWVANQYLWQFCLWRFQGIFEALIINTFLPIKPSKPMFGLKSKLNALTESGYCLSEKELDELIKWANLRNVLSHSPPEQYRPGPLRESDVLEYKRFLERLCERWRSEEKAVKDIL
jgi:hypothetical protein